MNPIKIITLAALVLLWTAGTAGAQTDPPPEDGAGWWFVPSVRTAGVHEDNLLFTGESRSVGSFLRVTPLFETRHRHPLRSLAASYSFDSEIHAPQFRALDDMLARHAALVSFEARPEPRSIFSAQMRYIATRRPEEVLEPTGLVAEHRRTRSYMGAAALDRELSPRSRGRIGYTFSFDDYGEPTDTRPSAKSAHHSLAAALTLRRDSRTTFGIEQSTKLLVGEDLTTRAVAHGTFWGGTLAFRVERSLTPRVRAILLVGPRLSQSLPRVILPSGTTPLDWKIAPDVEASVAYRSPTRLLRVAYGRGAFLGFGAIGFIETESLEVRASATVRRRLRLSVRPAIYRNALASLRAESYRVDAAAAFELSRWASLEATYLHKHQDRALTLADIGSGAPGRPKTRNTVVVAVSLRRPIRVR